MDLPQAVQDDEGVAVFEHTPALGLVSRGPGDVVIFLVVVVRRVDHAALVSGSSLSGSIFREGVSHSLS